MLRRRNIQSPTMTKLWFCLTKISLINYIYLYINYLTKYKFLSFNQKEQKWLVAINPVGDPPVGNNRSYFYNTEWRKFGSTIAQRGCSCNIFPYRSGRGYWNAKFKLVGVIRITINICIGR